MLHNRRIGKHFEDGQRLEKNLYRAYFAGQVWKANTLEELCEIIKIPFAPIKAYVEQGDSSKNSLRASLSGLCECIPGFTIL